MYIRSLKESCSKCGSKENLCTHHISYSPEITTVLCRKCHKTEHPHKGKVRPTNFKYQPQIGMKSINVEDKTWETLTIMKVKGKYSTMDDLIAELIVLKAVEETQA
jgi:hypothetical protein